MICGSVRTRFHTPICAVRVYLNWALSVPDVEQALFKSFFGRDAHRPGRRASRWVVGCLLDLVGVG